MTNEKTSMTERQCVLPSDIIDWILAHQKQLATILNTDEKIDGKYAIDESITFKTEADKIKGLISMLIQKESTEDKEAFCKKAERLLKNTTNDDNKELLQHLFYDKKGNFMPTKIILGINSNTYKSDLDREYLAKNATKVYSNYEWLYCIDIFIDNKTQHIITKNWGSKKEIFPQCRRYLPIVDTIIPIYEQNDYFSEKDSHILILDEGWEWMSYQHNATHPIDMPSDIDVTQIKDIKFTDQDKKTVRISFKDSENNPSIDADIVFENDEYTLKNIRESACT